MFVKSHKRPATAPNCSSNLLGNANHRIPRPIIERLDQRQRSDLGHIDELAYLPWGLFWRVR